MQREMDKLVDPNLHAKGKAPMLGRMNHSNSLATRNPRFIGTPRIVIENQSRPNIGNGSYFGANFQLGLGKRVREDGFIPGSSSNSAPVGAGNGNQIEDKEKPKVRRMHWTLERQQRFKEAYEALGETKATPARIKELMNEPQMTPQHISSYLQKFRARRKAALAEPTEAAKDEPTKAAEEEGAEDEGAEDEPTEAAEEEPMDSSVPRTEAVRSSYPPRTEAVRTSYPPRTEAVRSSYPTLSLNLNRASYPFNHQLNIPRPNPVPDFMPNYHYGSGNLLRNSSLYNFRASTSHNVTNILGQRVQGNMCSGLQPLEPFPGTGVFQSNVDYCPFHVLLQDLNSSFARAGDDIGARESAPRAIGIGRVQERNDGLGFVRNNIGMTKELTPEEIDNLYVHPGDHPGRDPSSPSSVTQPLPPHLRTATGEENAAETSNEGVTEEEVVNFINLEFSADCDGKAGSVPP